MPTLALLLTLCAAAPLFAVETTKPTLAPKGPKLDGKLSDPLWQQATPLALARKSGDGPELAASVRILMDGRTIYFGFECAEPNKTVKAGVKTRDGAVWQDDCVEIFISADLENGYKHFAINTLGVVFDQVCPAQGNHDGGWNSGVKAEAFFEPGKNWKAAVAIPIKDLGAFAGDNQIWRFNVTRTRPGAGKDADEFSWADLRGADYHQPAAFGELRGVNVPAEGPVRKIEPPRVGLEWSVHPDLRDIQAVFAHPLDPAALWCASVQGLLSSRDGGKTWQPVPSAAAEQTGEITTLAVSPGDPAVVVLGTRNKGLFISRDGGGAFAPIIPDAATSAASKDILNQPASAAIAFVHFSEVDQSWQTLLVSHGEAAPGLSITRNLGRTWAVYGRDRHFTLMAQSGETVVAVGSMVETGLKSWGLQRSIDEGDRWNEFSRGMQFSGGAFSMLTPDRFFFTARDGRVLESRDDGIVWTDVTPHADASWGSLALTLGRDAQTDMAVIYDPVKHGVLIGNALRAGRSWLPRNQNLYIGKFVKSGAHCRANANGSAFYIVQSGKLWLGTFSKPQAGPMLANVKCMPGVVMISDGAAFTVNAEVFHPKGNTAIKQVTFDFSIGGGEASTPLFDDGKHDDGAAGDGKWGAQVKLPAGFAWKIPREDRRRGYGIQPFAVTAVDSDGAKDTLPALLHVRRPPQTVTLFNGGEHHGRFNDPNDNLLKGQVEAGARDKAGIGGARGMVMTSKNDKPWRVVWGELFRSTAVNISGFKTLSFHVKGTVNEDLQVCLMDFFVEKDEQVDDFNFSRPVGCISGGYLKALTGEFQEVAIPLDKLLPPGVRFMRKRTIGICFQIVSNAKPGTFTVDRVQLLP